MQLHMASSVICYGRNRYDNKENDMPAQAVLKNQRLNIFDMMAWSNQPGVVG